MGRFSAATASRFMQIQQQNNAETNTHLCSDVVTGMEIVAKDAVNKWQQLSNEIRQRFGTDGVRNAVHASSDVRNKKAEMDLYFSN